MKNCAAFQITEDDLNVVASTDVEMQCADEDFALRRFTPSELTADGLQDYVCEHCGWQQTSTAAGAAELCRCATWHDEQAYQRYATVARTGGFEVPLSAPAPIRE